MARLYRVQDMEGRGPYRPGFSVKWSDAEGEILLPFWQEFGWSLASIPHRFYPGEHGGCGFRTLAQCAKWFTVAERVRLAKLGYQVVAINPDRILAESERQVVFARATHLSRDVVVVPWSALTEIARPEGR